MGGVYVYNLKYSSSKFSLFVVKWQSVINSKLYTMDANFELKLRTLLKRVNRLNIDLSELPAFKKYEKIKSYSYYKKYFIILICCIIVLIFLTYFIFIAMVTDSEEECYIYMPGVLSNAFRAPQLCDFCANITEIVKVANISPENFEKLYAYNAAPIIVTDATVNWTALNVLKSISKKKTKFNDFSISFRCLIFGILKTSMKKHERHQIKK